MSQWNLAYEEEM